jgi:predicted P-loop ATPase
MKNPLIEKFGDEPRWVNWKLQERRGKKTKVPYSPINNKLASSTDESTWSTYEDAISKSKNIGIVFTPEKTLLGIDIDHCLNAEGQLDHEHKEKIWDLIKEADTYTEVSPSGRGLHLYFILTEPLSLESNRSGSFECYTEGRYFTVTGFSFGSEKSVRTIEPNEAIEFLQIIGYPWKEAKTKDRQQVDSVTYDLLSDDDILTKMFASKNGKEIRDLYDGNITSQGGDISKADMSLCMHLAFWTRKNATQMEVIWLLSPLGQREKTQQRKDYRDRTIRNAIEACSSVYESYSEKFEKENPELELLFTINSKKDKVYTQCTENICRVLRHHEEFKGRIRYDTFTNKMEIRDKEKWRDVEDNDAIVIQTRISILFSMFQKVGKEMVFDAISTVAKENTIDSAHDYIRNLQWDGKARLDTWLVETYGVPNDEYHQKVGSNWLKGLVKRIAHPGCKFDYVLVLEGEQGTKKSTSLGVLGGSWHVETTMSTDTKDFFMQFQGKAIIEFSEGETLNRTEVKRMKAIITTQSDKYRPAYGRTSIDFPRRCIFAMTTNQTEYLKDETGNRRWLPIACVGEANVEWLTANRDQLFAEAYKRVIVDNETTWEFPEEETKRMQDSRRVTDANTELIQDWYFNKLTESQKKEGITVNQVWRDAVNNSFNNKPLDKYNEMNLSTVLKYGLGLIKQRRMIDGLRATRWFRKGDEEVEFTLIAPKQKDFGAFDEES